jgi:fatty-acyl-CoA synthase
MDWHLASVWEAVSDRVPDELALVHGDTTRSWREHDERSSRLAAALAAAGLGPDSKVALYLHNCPEYVEAQYAALKLRGVPVNVSYRYLDDELHYLLDNSDAEAVFFHSHLAERVARAVDRGLPRLRLLVEVDGETLPGARAYEGLVGSHEPMPRVERDGDDVYMLYTGGTTGMPKGVMYSQRDHTQKLLVMMAALTGQPEVTEPEAAAQMAEALHQNASRPVWLPACPLMHATGMLLGTMGPHLVGGTVVLLTSRSFDADELWRAVERHSVTGIVVVGDAFGRPMLDALERAERAGVPYDTSSVQLLFTGGAALSSDVKQQLLARLPETAAIIDVLGSSEGGMGSSLTTRDETPGTSRFTLDPSVRVLGEDGWPVAPGSGEIGRVAISQYVPLGYYKDPEKSARTFPVIHGTRYSIPGDFATVELDGSVTLLGRGSQVINSGGEKVFCEEVEEAVKAHPEVLDCLVVGLPDDRLGNRVVAVVSTQGEVSEEVLIGWVKTRLAGYKAPKRVVFTAAVPRQPNGKPDYTAARQHATAGV